MLNICLCDDDENILNNYSAKIAQLAIENNYAYTIETFKSGESLIFQLEDNPTKYNILIIDIVMNRINGIETTKILRKYGYNGIIIFLTSSKEFALDSFEVEPLNYLLKDDKNNRFADIFLKAAKQIYKYSNKNLLIPYKNQIKIINLDTIVYLEMINKKIIIHKLFNEVESTNCTLKYLYEKIENQDFIQCHKSYIVNIKFIKFFNNLECHLLDGNIIPIGRKYCKTFKETILENEFDNIIL